MNWFIKLVVGGAVMGLADFLWLGTIAKKLYHDVLGELVTPKPRWYAALSFYFIYLVGVIVFAANRAGSWRQALLYGAGFGFVAYATYDLTNLATLKAFTPRLAVIDIVWGTVLTAAVTLAAYAAGSWWAGR